MIDLIRKEDVDKLEGLVPKEFKELIEKWVVSLTEDAFDADKRDKGFNRTVHEFPGYFALIESDEDFEIFNKRHNANVFDPNEEEFNRDWIEIIQCSDKEESKYLSVYHWFGGDLGVTLLINFKFLPEDSFLFNEINKTITI